MGRRRRVRRATPVEESHFEPRVDEYLNELIAETKRRNRRRRLLWTLGPVSYTHLDVYKRQLVITSGSAAGTVLPLDDSVITIGRSTDSTLAIVDEYTSTYHAKLARNGDQWMLTDLDSTNGTKLGGSRVTGTVLVPTFTPVTIGTTTFELRP